MVVEPDVARKGLLWVLAIGAVTRIRMWPTAAQSMPSFAAKKSACCRGRDTCAPVYVELYRPPKLAAFDHPEVALLALTRQLQRLVAPRLMVVELHGWHEVPAHAEELRELVLGEVEEKLVLPIASLRVAQLGLRELPGHVLEYPTQDQPQLSMLAGMANRFIAKFEASEHLSRCLA